MSVACMFVFQMLCGLSIELCLKGVVVAKGGRPESIHNLESLARQAGVTYDERSQGLLRVLSDAVVWFAKYPTPKGSATQARTTYESAMTTIFENLFDKKPFGSLTVLSPNGSLDWIGFNQLWDVAQAEYWRFHRDH